MSKNAKKIQLRGCIFHFVVYIYTIFGDIEKAGLTWFADTEGKLACLRMMTKHMDWLILKMMNLCICYCNLKFVTN